MKARISCRCCAQYLEVLSDITGKQKIISEEIRIVALVRIFMKLFLYEFHKF